MTISKEGNQETSQDGIWSHQNLEAQNAGCVFVGEAKDHLADRRSAGKKKMAPLDILTEIDNIEWNMGWPSRLPFY